MALPEEQREKVLVTTTGVWRTVSKTLGPIIDKEKFTTRPTLQCIAVSRVPGASATDGLQFVATDGYRLGVANKWALWNALTEPLLIPGHILAATSLLWRKAESVTVYRLNRLAYQFVTENGTTLTTQVYDGKFPDWHSIVPKEWQGRITVERQALERIVMLAAQVTEPLTCTREGAWLRFNGTWEGRQINGRVQVEGETDATLLSRMNVGYLAQVCAAMPGSRIHLNCPCLLYTSDAADE